MAATILDWEKSNWTAAFPLAWTFSYDATGADTLVLLINFANSHAYTPTVTYDGVAMDLVVRANAGTGDGTVGIWKLDNPSSGSNTVAISSAGNFASDGLAYAVSIEGSNAGGSIGDSDAVVGASPTTVTLTLADSGNLVLGTGGTYFNPLDTWTGSPTPTVLDTDTSSSQIEGRLITGSGNVDFKTTSSSNAGGALVEILGVATIEVAGLTATFTIGAITVQGPQGIVAPGLTSTFSLGSMSVARAGDVNFPFMLAPGQSIVVGIKFVPTAIGARTGALIVTSDAATSPDEGALSGVGIGELTALHTDGPDIKDASGNVVRLRSVNWFGAESTTYCPHGLWARAWRDIIDQIAGFGFNCIRLPFSDDILDSENVPNGIDTSLNADLVGLSALQILDAIFAYAATKGIYIVLDQHRRSAGTGTDHWPPAEGDDGYTMEMWQTAWGTLATRYASTVNVIGADVHNEPHLPSWDTWAGMVEEIGDHIHTIASHWLIFCEGVGTNPDETSYWWGGALKGVASRPVVLEVSNRVVYSPHEYGQSVAVQSWLRYDSDPSIPVGYPDNLYAVWQANWGFIFEDGIAPIWIGEFGGHFGVDGDGEETEPHGTYEAQWVTELCKYLNGDFDGDDDSDLDEGSQGMSFAYWSYNPNSGDTGGLVRDDWTTPQSVKLTLLTPLLEGA